MFLKLAFDDRLKVPFIRSALEYTKYVYDYGPTVRRKLSLYLQLLDSFHTFHPGHRMEHERYTKRTRTDIHVLCAGILLGEGSSDARAWNTRYVRLLY